MHPTAPLNYIAIAASVLASFIFGFFWYGPLFGKKWAALMGFKMEDCKDKKPEAYMFILSILGSVFTGVILSYLIPNWHPSCVAAMAWLGFQVPILFSQITWEGKPKLLFVLNATYYFLNLQMVALILSLIK